MGLFFTTVDENPLTGTTEDIELVPGGSELPVTDHNKFRYIYMVADYKLNRRIKRQSDAFVSGFHECITLNWLHIFEESQVQMLISGRHTSIDVKDLMKHTVYIGGFSSYS